MIWPDKNETTENYWDCECEYNYIHPKSQKECLKCGTNSEKQPNSIINEVFDIQLEK